MGIRYWITCLIHKKCVFDKWGIDYKPNLKQKYYKNYFTKSTSINNQVVCHHCNQDGHMKNKGPVKRNAYYGAKYIWVPKGIIVNTQEPMSIWVSNGTTWIYIYIFCRYHNQEMMESSMMKTCEDNHLIMI